LKKIGIDKARERLRQANEDLARLAQAQTYEQFRSAWVSLLTSGNAVENILEKAASGDAKSKPWFGKKKWLRKNAS
jgi:hypothetical protein